MSRPVAMEAADMGGPYQGKRVPVGCRAQGLLQRLPPARHSASSRAGGDGRPPPRPRPRRCRARRAPSRPPREGLRVGQVRSARGRSRRGGRSDGPRSSPAAGVPRAHAPFQLLTRRSSSSPSRPRSSITDKAASDTMRSPRGTTVCSGSLAATTETSKRARVSDFRAGTLIPGARKLARDHACPRSTVRR